MATKASVATFWVSKSKSITYTSAFSIGSAMKATQVHSTSNGIKLVYTKKSSTATAAYALCGSDGLPTTATHVRES
ncbi:hypothetical protein [Actinotalea sp. C106]|uniref:hypothetical protein n=1 Tax=Actinotalea sp. C106 TaxID=2908644 RepID=UPI002028DEED|nr:hypothetical protein [Actinotalea sp. C106]